MCALLFGDAFMEDHPVVTGNCNGNSPLVWDETMLGAMRAFCRRNQPVLCSPFVLGGANTPASTAAAVAQLNAEALSSPCLYPGRATPAARAILRPLFVHRIHEIGSTDGRHAGNQPDEYDDRPDGAAL